MLTECVYGKMTARLRVLFRVHRFLFFAVPGMEPGVCACSARALPLCYPTPRPEALLIAVGLSSISASVIKQLRERIYLAYTSSSQSTESGQLRERIDLAHTSSSQPTESGQEL